ncbi:methionyl-tRNA formyltransferase [Candidatus Parcubacteria bacterium]|nr:methionyl-tRNA formyltransferase [Candidatus Parcubacteria bacterium]
MHSDNHKIKTIFIGTPDFAVLPLKDLVEDGYFDVAAVITQPDKPAGRKQILTPPPVKIEAEKYKIPVFQPEQIKNFQSEIKNLKPEVIIVAAYAQLIPEKILNMPRYGCINVHGSLLPKYRGAAVIQAPILYGDKETGITIMKMDAGLDTGPILSQSRIKIHPTDNAGTLYNQLSQIGANLLVKTLKKYINGEIKPIAQDEEKASYVGMLKKKDGKINWSKPAKEIERFIRAMTPWPGAYAQIKSHLILKILKTEYKPISVNRYKQGELFLHDKQIAIQCGKDALIIKKLQLAGKKQATAEEFLRGHDSFIGIILR